MKKPRTRVSKELKEKICAELLQEGCNIQSVGAQYGLTVKTINKWKSDCKKQSQTSGGQKANNRFIELSLPPVTSKILCLKKVELTFEDYSCSIVGKIKSNQLLKLLQLLEGGLC